VVFKRQDTSDSFGKQKRDLYVVRAQYFFA